MKNTPLDPKALRERALRLLARREHSRLELQRKLQPCAQDPSSVQALLDDFTRRGWLNEERVATSLVHRKASRMGVLRIRQELIQLGLSADLVQSTCSELATSEGLRAREVLIRKYGHPAQTREEQARQMRFLLSRGFSGDAIREALKPDATPQDQLA